MKQANLTRNRRRHPDVPMDVPICSRCGKPNDRAPHRYCRQCRADYQRDYRARVPRETNVLRGDEARHVARAVACLDGEGES